MNIVLLLQIELHGSHYSVRKFLILQRAQDFPHDAKQINQGIDDYFVEYSDEEYIDFLYSNLLEREESSEEREGWVIQIDNGLSREEIFNTFMNSEEFRDKQRYDNAG